MPHHTNTSVRFTRRRWLQAGLATAALSSLPPRVQAGTAGGQLRTAHIGVGGMGGADLRQIASHDRVVVAGLCDVDAERLKAAQEKHPDARSFADYRQMLAEMADSIDAVVVSTPDHTHAPAAMTAIQLGKPVYCQKPLTHSVHEARQLRLAARDKALVTQMGIQVHSSAAYRGAVAIVHSGMIGKVSQVVAWSNKNWGYDGGPLTASQSPPDSLHWDLWLGTAAARPYVPKAYHPSAWRKLIDFGTGTLGDMGVHIFDTPYAALQLTAPKWVETTCRQPTGIGHPERNIVRYEFPATPHTTDSLLWTWYDGGWAPPSIDELQWPAELGLPAELPSQGSLLLGSEGAMLLPHVAQPQLFPQAKFKGRELPEVAGGNHYHEWVDACLGQGDPSASFDYAGPLTEALLLGVVANRFPETKLDWDAAELQFTNHPEANHLLRRPYRDGFQVEGL